MAAARHRLQFSEGAFDAIGLTNGTGGAAAACYEEEKGGKDEEYEALVQERERRARLAAEEEERRRAEEEVKYKSWQETEKFLEERTAKIQAKYERDVAYKLRNSTAAEIAL
uniref:Uncharacterized protein n=1 Tax=Hemiselmis andersenii TaxID=464988 RepID=A0A7S1DR70_HEMAN